MKLQDSDIISAARDLRDEQNEQLYVAPTPLKGRRTLTPLWWGAVAAALVVGFFVGKSLTPNPSPEGEGTGHLQELALSQSSNEKTPLSHGRGVGGEAIIREVIHEVVHDTIYETRIVRVPTPSSQQPTAQAEPDPSPGCSMLCDDIRYDLLAGN